MNHAMNHSITIALFLSLSLSHNHPITQSLSHTITQSHNHMKLDDSQSVIGCHLIMPACTHSSCPFSQVSILFASGDSGYVVNQKFGASSPYVTAVGGVDNGELGGDVLQVKSEK